MTGYQIAAADPIADRAAILRLWTDNFLHATPARYDWLYGRRALGEPHCLLLRAAAGETVGLNTLLPRRVLWCGREQLIGQAVDLAVDPAHRAAGPVIRLQRELLRRANAAGMPAVYGFPLPAAEAVLRRIGYRTLGPFRRWVRVVAAGDLRAPGALRGVGRAAAGWAQGWLHRLPRGWRITTDDGFDAAFDLFWREAAGQFDLLGERSRAFLRARFADSPKGDYRLLRLLDPEQRMVGYVVFHRRKPAVAKVVDALARAPAEWPRLMAAFAAAARHDGALRVDFPLLAPAWLERALYRVGFRPRRRDASRANNNVVLYRFSPAAAEEAWYLTFADTDAD